MTYSLLITTAPDLPELCLEVFPEWQLSETSPTFAALDQLGAWSHERDFHSKRSGPYESTVKWFYRENGHVMLIDHSMLITERRAELERLSSRIGDLFIVTMQTTSGYAAYQKYADGEQVREIISVNGDIESKGDDDSHDEGTYAEFYFKEIETILAKIGVTAPDSGAARSCWGLHVWDASENPNGLPPRAPKKPRPWWKFW